MSKIVLPELVRPLVGLLVGQKDQCSAIVNLLEPLLGNVIKASDIMPFTQTDYYTPEMGGGLWRQYLVFETLRDAADLADWKIATNQLELDFGKNQQGGRKINIDPGYLAPGKLVLASTKDHGHRLYLRKGIYAEITLKVEKKKFVTWPWSYPDYAAMSWFFDEAYKEYLQTLKVMVNSQ